MFEQTFKNIDDVLWKEAGCATELDYTEQTSWILFLKYLDDLEKANEQRAELQSKKYQYIIDKQRVVVHGMGLGGQMAFYLGFHNRDTFRGVATTGAVLANQVKEKLPAQPLSFYIIAGGKDPLAKPIAESKTKLVNNKYSVIFREIPNMGHQYHESGAHGRLDSRKLLTHRSKGPRQISPGNAPGLRRPPQAQP